MHGLYVRIVACSCGEVLVDVIHGQDHLGEIWSCTREKGGGILEKLYKMIKQSHWLQKKNNFTLRMSANCFTISHSQSLTSNFHIFMSRLAQSLL